MLIHISMLHMNNNQLYCLCLIVSCILFFQLKVFLVTETKIALICKLWTDSYNHQDWRLLWKESNIWPMGHLRLYSIQTDRLMDRWMRINYFRVFSQYGSHWFSQCSFCSVSKRNRTEVVDFKINFEQGIIFV